MTTVSCPRPTGPSALALAIPPIALLPKISKLVKVVVAVGLRSDSISLAETARTFVVT